MKKLGNVIEQKSFDFALDIIELYKKLLEKKEYVISKQLLKSGTSIGANVKEAQAAQSKKDFLSKMSIASKEARETEYWLSLLKESKLVKLNYDKYLENSREIIRIITAIVKTTAKEVKT
ncbi:MAG: four helix bundle protein [Spirochaetia bacterium]|nr:four helix bundle protein [Spirochaetia bacterium]